MEERLVDETKLMPAGCVVVHALTEGEILNLQEVWRKTLPAGYSFCPWQSFIDFELWLYERFRE